MVDLTDASDAAIERSVDDFEAALHAREPRLIRPRLERLLLATDASNQGAAAERLAAALARDNRTRIALAYAYEGGTDAQRDAHALTSAARLAGEGVALEPREPVPTDHTLRSFEQVLRAIVQVHADLVVTCAPYLDDYRSLGEHSVGAHSDVLMCRSERPLLLVRDPQRTRPEDTLARVALAMPRHALPTPLAASWALKCLRPGGELRCLLAPQESEERPAGLIAALQRHCAAAGIACRVETLAAAEPSAIAEHANDDAQLLVLGSSADVRSLAFHCAQALVRHSRNPVLFVRD